MAGSEREPDGRDRHAADDLRSLSDDDLLSMSDVDFDALTADVVAALAQGPITIEPETPSESLWESIAGELELDADPSEGSAHGGPHTISTTPVYGVTFDPLGSGPASGPAARKAQARWGGRTAFVTLAAACLLVLVPLGIAIRGGDQQVEVAASADLNVIPGVETARPGHADLVLEGDKALLELDVEAQPAQGEYLELWLLAVDDEGEVADLVSLGPIDGSGTYEIPADVDRSRFTVVDISTEPDDGNHDHSGHSLLRGALTA